MAQCTASVVIDPTHALHSGGSAVTSVRCVLEAGHIESPGGTPHAPPCGIRWVDLISRDPRQCRLPHGHPFGCQVAEDGAVRLDLDLAPDIGRITPPVPPAQPPRAFDMGENAKWTLTPVYRDPNPGARYDYGASQKPEWLLHVQHREGRPRNAAEYWTAEEALLMLDALTHACARLDGARIIHEPWIEAASDAVKDGRIANAIAILLDNCHDAVQRDNLPVHAFIDRLNEAGRMAVVSKVAWSDDILRQMDDARSTAQAELANAREAEGTWRYEMDRMRQERDAARQEIARLNESLRIVNEQRYPPPPTPPTSPISTSSPRSSGVSVAPPPADGPPWNSPAEKLAAIWKTAKDRMGR